MFVFRHSTKDYVLMRSPLGSKQSNFQRDKAAIVVHKKNEASTLIKMVGTPCRSVCNQIMEVPEVFQVSLNGKLPLNNS